MVPYVDLLLTALISLGPLIQISHICILGIVTDYDQTIGCFIFYFLSGTSLLASTLVEWQTSELCDREELEYIVLVKNLLSMKGLLDAEEVLHLMVEPFLIIECSRNLKKLILPLELLKVLYKSFLGLSISVVKFII